MYLDLDWRTGSRNVRGGAIFKVKMTQNSLGARWRVMKRADPSLSTR